MSESQVRTPIVRPSLNYFKFETRNVCINKGWDKISVEQLWILLTEEVGELASAIRQNMNLYKNKYKRKRGTDIEAEMADVFSYLFQLADKLDVDMDVMWEHWRQKSSGKKYDVQPSFSKKKQEISTQTDVIQVEIVNQRET